MRRVGRIVLIAAMVAAGCSTVERARESQRQLEPKSIDDVVSVLPPVRLEGASLESLVAFALTNRPSVAAAALAVEDARLQLRALAADAPLVSETPWNSISSQLSANYSEASAGTHWRDHKFKTDGSPSAALSLSVLVYDFGRNDAELRAQAERVVSAEQSLVEAGYEVFSEVAENYFTLRSKEALYQVALSNEFEYATHLEQAETRYGAGEADRLDVLRARLDLAEARQSSVNASNNIITAGAELMRSLGIDAARGTFREVLGPAPAPLRAPFKAFDATVDDEKAAFALARTNAPAMRIVRAKLRAASSAVDSAVADLKPSVSASLSFSWSDPLWYWNWGASAVQSLFEGGSKLTAIDRAVVAMKSASAEVDRAEQSLSADISLAVAERDNAVIAGDTAAVSVARAQENLESVRAEFDVGDASRVELSDSVAEYYAAMGTRISAFYRGQIAEAKLFALLGRYPVYNEMRVPLK